MNSGSAGMQRGNGRGLSGDRLSFIQQKIAERKAKQESNTARSKDAANREQGRSERAKAKAEDIASRHKRRAKGIAKSRGNAMKQPGPENA